MKSVGRLVKVFMITLLILVLMLIIVWTIPETAVSDHVNDALQILEEEGVLWEDHFTYAWGAALDNATDAIMIKRAVSTAEEGRTILFRAFYCNDYGRYWHGYLVILRPLLAVMSYLQIRYLFMVIHIAALVGIALKIYKRFGKSMVCGWVISMIMINFISLPFSLQFSWVFFIMYGAVCYIDWCCDRKKMINDNIESCAFFMVIGMLTSFMDLLTAPVLSLGMPLLYLLLLRIQQKKETGCKRNILFTVGVSFSWAVGYIGCWVMKWLLAIPILKENLLLESVSRINMRTRGAIDYGLGQIVQSSFMKAIIYNIYALLPPGLPSKIELSIWIVFLIFMLISVAVLAILFVRYHETKEVLLSYTPIVILLFYPYIWYGITTQHAQIHSFFTYRNQIITVMGGWIIVSKCIKWEKIKSIFVRNLDAGK